MLIALILIGGLYLLPIILSFLLSYIYWLILDDKENKTLGDYLDYWKKELDGLSIIFTSLMPAANILFVLTLLFIPIAYTINWIIDHIYWELNEMRNLKIRK